MTPLLRADRIEKTYAARAGFSLGGQRQVVQAVRGADLEIAEGEILGLVGESGCGKSTLARIVALLEPASSGTLSWRGQDLGTLGRRHKRGLHRQIQLILQDPYDSLDPRQRILDTVAEPLDIHGSSGSPNHRREQVAEMLANVGLSKSRRILEAYPRSLSGGERQRVAIARAMVLRPDLIVADEPLSMVDVSARADIMNLILHLRETFDTAFLYVTHDLAAARHLCSRIAVMYMGRIVELGQADQVLEKPEHPYSDLLRSAVPVADPAVTRPRVADGGEPPDPSAVPAGCAFHPRCPYARARCSTDDPALLPTAGGREVACHFPLSTSRKLEETG